MCIYFRKPFGLWLEGHL